MGKSVLTDQNKCAICGSPCVQWHHVFFGTANRKISDHYGYIIPLCREHHTGQVGVHANHQMDLYFKKIAQKHFEENTGSREDFIRVFGKSYL